MISGKLVTRVTNLLLNMATAIYWLVEVLKNYNLPHNKTFARERKKPHPLKSNSLGFNNMEKRK